MGDLNIDLLRLPEMCGSLDLLNLFLMYAYVSVVNSATLATPNSISLIDVIFTNNSANLSYSSTNMLTCSISDHFLLAYSIHTKFLTDNTNSVDFTLPSYLITERSLNKI